MVESALLWLHLLLLFTSAVEQQKNDVMKESGLVVGGYTKEEKNRRDSDRVKQALERSKKKNKEYRQTRRLAKAQEEQLRKRREGITNEAGGFNDISPLTGPQKKKRKS